MKSKTRLGEFHVNKKLLVARRKNKLKTDGCDSWENLRLALIQRLLDSAVSWRVTQDAIPREEVTFYPNPRMSNMDLLKT